MKYFKNIIMLVALVGVTLLTSCTKEDPISTEDGGTFNYVSYGTYIEDLQISNATLESDIQILNAMEPELVDNGGFLGGKMPMLPFREIFRMLNFTEEQMKQVREFMKIHIECERIARMKYYETIAPILKAANEERKAIREKVAAGMDKREAYKLLRELDIRIQKAIKETGAMEILRKSLKDCTDELIAKLKRIMTPEQLAKFEKWLNRKMGGTGGSNTGTGTGTRP
jgi:Spy/CpxP family protein refolding chaperone